MEERKLGWGSLKPAVVIGLNVVPLCFKLVSDGPEEVSLEVGVEGINSTVSEVFHIGGTEVVRVSWAHSLVDTRDWVSSKWSERFCGSVEVSGLGGHVRGWALNHSALIDIGGVVGIVEATKPHGTGVSSKSPLTNPDVILDVVLGNGSLVLVVLAVLLNWLDIILPGLVVVMVHDNVFVIIISKHIIPDISTKSKGVMEDKLDIWVRLVDDVSSLHVEVLEGV